MQCSPQYPQRFVKSLLTCCLKVLNQPTIVLLNRLCRRLDHIILLDVELVSPGAIEIYVHSNSVLESKSSLYKSRAY